MPDPRTFVWFGRHAGARFRCRVCQRFVRATERGVCPSCGMPPADFTPVAGRRYPVAGEPPSWRGLGRPALRFLLLAGLSLLALSIVARLG